MYLAPIVPATPLVPALPPTLFSHFSMIRFKCIIYLCNSGSYYIPGNTTTFTLSLVLATSCTIDDARLPQEAAI